MQSEGDTVNSSVISVGLHKPTLALEQQESTMSLCVFLTGYLMYTRKPLPGQLLCTRNSCRSVCEHPLSDVMVIVCDVCCLSTKECKCHAIVCWSPSSSVLFCHAALTIDASYHVMPYILAHVNALSELARLQVMLNFYLQW